MEVLEMGGKAMIEECSSCHQVRPIRVSSGLCYSCHWWERVKTVAEVVAPVSPRGSRDAEELVEIERRRAVRRAADELFSTWGMEPSAVVLERSENAAWALIEAVEDLLGKE